MFERLFTSGINAFLRDTLQVTSASFSIWSGRLLLEDIDLNKFDLEEYTGLPMIMKYGRINKLMIDIPWNDFYGKTTTVVIEGVYMLAVPKPDKPYDEETVQQNEWNAKQAELTSLETKLKQAADITASETADESKSFVGKLIATLLRNLEIRIENYHFRYEDKELFPGKITTLGLMLKEFLVKTTDEQWAPLAIPENMPTMLKILKLEGISFYVNCNSNSYDSLELFTMIELLKKDLAKPDSPEFMYVLYPVLASGNFQVSTTSSAGFPPKTEKPKVKEDPPWLQCDFGMEKVAVTLRKCQYHVIIEFSAMLMRKQRRQKYDEYRPDSPVHENCAVWWQFAYTCVLKTVVKRRRKMWSWENIKRHRDACAQYRLKYFERLDKGLTKQIKEELEMYEKMLDIYNIILLRRQAEMKFERVKEQRGDPSNFLVSWVRWIMSWFRRSEPEVYDNVFTSEEKKKLYEKLYLEFKTVEEGLPEYISIKMSLKVKSIKLKLQDADLRLDEVVSEIVKSGKTKVSELPINIRDKVMKIDLDEIVLDLLSKPGAGSYRIALEVKALDFLGLPATPDADRPVVARSLKSDKEEPWIFLRMELNPLHSANNSDIITLRLQSFDVTLDLITIQAISIFFTPPRHLYLDHLQEMAVRKLKQLKEQTRSSLLQSIESHLVFEFAISIHPVTAVIPSSSDMKTCARMVILFGPLDIVTVPHHRLEQIIEAVKAKKDIPLYKLKEKAYDEFIITLANLQMLFAAEGEDWLQYKKFVDSSVHVLKPFAAQMKVYKCVITDVDLPELRVLGSTAALQISISNERLSAILKMMAGLATPEEESTDDDIEGFKTITGRMTIARDNHDEIAQVIEAATLSAEKSKEKSRRKRFDMCHFEAKLKVDEICINFAEMKGSTEVPALKMTIREIGANCLICDSSWSYDAYVGKVFLQHLQFQVNEEVKSWFEKHRSREASLGGPVCLIDTVKTDDGRKSRLFNIDIKMALFSSVSHPAPIVVSTTVTVQLKGLDVLLHKEAIVHSLLMLAHADLFSEPRESRVAVETAPETVEQVEQVKEKKKEKKKGKQRGKKAEKKTKEKMEKKLKKKTKKQKEEKNERKSENKKEKQIEKKAEEKAEVKEEKTQEKTEKKTGEKVEERKSIKTEEKTEKKTGEKAEVRKSIMTEEKNEKKADKSTNKKSVEFRESRTEERTVKSTEKRNETRRGRTTKKKARGKRVKERPKQSTDIGNFYGTAVLSKLSLAVCSDRLLVTDVVLTHLESGVTIESNATEFGVSLEKIVVHNCLPSLYPMVVSCEEGQMLKVKVSAKKKVDVPPKEIPSYNVSVDVNCGSVKVVILLSFIARLMELISYVPPASESQTAEESTESIFVRLSALPGKIANSLSDGTVLSLLRYHGEFNTNVHCPVIIVPANDISSDVFVVSLGVLNLKSEGSGAQLREVDDMIIRLSSFGISRMLIQNASVSPETPILEPATIELMIYRSLNPLRHPELPLIDMSCRVSWLSLSMDSSDYMMLNGLMEQNAAVETPSQTELTDTDIERLQTFSGRESVSVADEPQEGKPATSTTSLVGFDLISVMRFSLVLDGFELELNSGCFDPSSSLSSLYPEGRIIERDSRKSVLKLQLKMLTTKVDVRFNGAFTISQTVHSCVLRDERPDSEEGVTRGYVIFNRSSSELQNFITMIYLANPHVAADDSFLSPAQRIQRYQSYLENTINPHPGLLMDLLDTGVLLEDEFQHITSSEDRYGRTQKLLEVISRKSGEAFQRFCDAMSVYHQKHVVALLENVDVDINGLYVVINYFYVALSMDFLNAVRDVVPQFSSAADHNTQRSSTGQRLRASFGKPEALALTEPIERMSEVLGEKTEKRTRRSGRLFDLYFSLNDVEVVLLEDSRKIDSVALITKIQMDAWISDVLEGERENLVFFSSVKFKSLLAAIYSNVATKCEIIGAVEVEVDSRIPQISLSDDIVISLSPVALNMMSTVLKTFIVPKAIAEEVEDVPVDLWNAKKIPDFNFWFLQPKWLDHGIAMKTRESQQDEELMKKEEIEEKVEEKKAKDDFEMTLDRLCIVMRLTDKRSRLSVMSQLSLAKFHLKSSNGEVNLGCRFMLESYYYNIKSAAWEPVVDVVDGEEPGTQKPWEMTLKVEAQAKAPLLSGDIKQIGAYKVSCLAPDMLKLTITDAMLQSFVHLRESIELGMNIADILDVSSLGGAPYRFQNKCGKDITVKLGASFKFSKIPHDSAVLETGESMEFYNSDTGRKSLARSKFLAVNKLTEDGKSADDGKLTADAEAEAKNIHLIFKEYDAERSFSLSRSGNKWAFVLRKEDMLRATWELVTKIEGYFGQIIITFRSTVQIYNRLQFEVIVYYQHVRGDPVLVGQLMPDTSLSLPYMAVYTPPYRLHFKPVGDQHEMSTEFEWMDADTKKKPDALECKSTSQKISSIFIQPQVEVENILYESTGESTVKTLKVRLHPPLVLKNLLPIVVETQLITKLEKAIDKIEPGRDIQLYKADPNETRLKATIVYNDHTWIGRCLITSSLTEFMIWNFKEDQKKTDKMGLGLHCCRSNGFLELDLFCPYWMVNLTECNLFYKAGISSIVPHKTDFQGAVLFPYSISLFGAVLHRGSKCCRGQQQCNCFGTSQRGHVKKSDGTLDPAEHKAAGAAVFKKPIDNSDPEMRSNVMINVRLDNSDWSDEFCIDVIGTIEQVKCKLKWRYHYLSVNAVLSSTGLTRIITFKPFYTVMNQARFTIWFRENLPSATWIMATHNQCLPFWPRHLKEMVVGIADSPDSMTPSVFTRPFPITTTARTLLKINHKVGAIHVQCSVGVSGVQILCQPYTSGTATALLVNHTEDAIIVFHQLDVAEERRALEPGEAVLYTWNDPLGKRELVWTCANSVSYKDKLDRDGVGTVEADSVNEIKWLSFLDGKQRIFMVTDDQLVVESFSEVVTERIDMEIEIRLSGLSMTLFSTRYKQPIACFTIDGYVVAWKLEMKGVFKKIRSKSTAEALEELYQEYLEDLKTDKEANPRRKLPRGRLDVDFDTMELYKPDTGQLKRGFEWGLSLKLQLSPQYALIHFKLKQFELRNLLPAAVYESVSAPVARALYGNPEKSPRFLELSIVAKNSAYSNIVQLKYFEVLIQPVEFQVELSFVLSLLRLMTPKAAKEQQLKLFQADCMHISRTLNDDVIDMHMEGFLLYCDLLRISPLEVHMSFSWLIVRTDDEKKRVRQELFLESVGGMMSDINDVELRLGFFERKFAFYTLRQLAVDVGHHYSQQALKQIYVFVFGWDILGNPFAVLRDLKHGFEDLFYHPYYGAIESPEAFFRGILSGSQSMAGHTVSGFAGAGSRITRALGKGLVSAASDRTYKRKRRELLCRHPNGFTDGICRGSQGLLLGLTHGVTGVVLLPYQGAEKGCFGVCKGVAGGVVGVVVLPVTGIFDFISVTLEGIRKSAKNACAAIY